VSRGASSETGQGELSTGFIFNNYQKNHKNQKGERRKEKMKKNLKLLKSITCVLGITFLVMGMVPFGKVDQAAPEFSISGIKTVLGAEKLGIGEECEKDSDCDSKYCDEANTCQDKPTGGGSGGCTKNQECEKTEVCSDSACVALTCDPGYSPKNHECQEDDSGGGSGSDTCQVLNSECSGVSADGKQCCPGLVCVLFNVHSGNYKCAASGTVLGCTNSEANNYNPAATADDGSCTYDGPGDVLGCTDPDALNFDPAATIDDDSCTYDEPGGGGSSGGGGGGLPIPVTGDPMIIPVTGVDLMLDLTGLQQLFTYMGLMMFGVTMMLEGVERKFYK
jgi:hypothetical protein